MEFFKRLFRTNPIVEEVVEAIKENKEFITNEELTNLGGLEEELAFYNIGKSAKGFRVCPVITKSKRNH